MCTCIPPIHELVGNEEKSVQKTSVDIERNDIGGYFDQ